MVTRPWSYMCGGQRLTSDVRIGAPYHSEMASPEPTAHWLARLAGQSSQCYNQICALLHPAFVRVLRTYLNSGPYAD